MARKNQLLWDQLKAGAEVSFIAHKDYVETLIAGVVELKCEENTVRKQLDLIPYGRLIITRKTVNDEQVKVTMKQRYPINL